MRKRLALLLALSLLLSGCWDRTELEDRAYLVVLGIDRGETGGLTVTAVIALTPSLTPSAMGGVAQPSGRVAAEVMTVEADTITYAILMFNGMASRRVDLRQTRAVVFGESLAREGLRGVVSELLRSPDARATMLLSQAQGRAEEILKAIRPISEVNPARMVEGIGMQAKYLHLAPPVRLQHFAARLSAEGVDPLLPVLALNLGYLGKATGRSSDESALPGELQRTSSNPVDFVGTAVFQEDRLAGMLTVDETQMLLALRGEMGKAYVTIPDPVSSGMKVSMRLHQENVPSYRPYFEGGLPRLDVRLLMECEVLSIPGGVDYSQPANGKRLERSLDRTIERTTRELTAKLAIWGADPAGFGLKYRRQFRSMAQWHAFGWQRRVPDLTVNVVANSRIRRYGMILAPLPYSTESR